MTNFEEYCIIDFVKKSTKSVNSVTKVPEGTISRLFIYLRELTALQKLNINTISSAELGDRTNFSDAQVRKDFGHFGQFGTSGAGYDVTQLKNALEKILGKDKTWNVVIIGAGHLGSALMTYPGFKNLGLEIVAALDADKRKVGKLLGNIEIQPIDQLAVIVKAKKVSIGIIAVPKEAAQEAADNLVQAGIKCILNFAPLFINVPEDVKVKSVDLSHELEELSYYLVAKK